MHDSFTFKLTGVTSLTAHPCHFNIIISFLFLLLVCKTFLSMHFCNCVVCDKLYMLKQT